MNDYTSYYLSSIVSNKLANSIFFLEKLFFLMSTASQFKLIESTLFEKIMPKRENKYAAFHKP